MRIILLLFLLLSALHLQAQESPGLKDVIVDTTYYIPVYKYRNIGLSYSTTRDMALSPLVFQGPGATFSATSWRFKNEWLWQTNFDSRIHLLKNDPGTSTMNEIGFSYQASALREIPQWQQNNWRFWLGPEARMLLNTRIHSRNTNNVASYDWATSLGATAMVSTKFRFLKRTFAISNQLQLPLAFVYTRPPYAWGIPPAIFEKEKGAWKEAFQFGTLNDIMLIANRVNLDFYLKKRKNKKVIQFRAFRLTYAWSYFQTTTNNKVQTGGHQLSLSRVITF